MLQARMWWTFSVVVYKLLLHFLPRDERGVRGKAIPQRLEGWAFDHPRDTPGRMDADWFL